MIHEPLDADVDPQDPLLAALSDERAFRSDPARIAKAVEGVRRGRERWIARWISAAAILTAAIGLFSIPPEDPPPEQVAQKPTKTDWLFLLPDAAFRGPGEPVAMHDAAFEVAILSAREQPRLVLMEKQLTKTRANGDDER